MSAVADIVGIAIMALMVFSITHLFYKKRGELKFIWHICRRFRITMLFEVLLLLAVIVILIIILMAYIPFLAWGWWSLFSSDGMAGNILIAPFIRYIESPSRIVVALILLFFLEVSVMLPFLAKEEEDLFRKGHNDWRSISKQSVIFGLAHLAVGIPIAAGIVLILPGFFFGYKYKKALVPARLYSNKFAHYSEYEIKTEQNTEQNDEDVEDGWFQYDAVLVSTTYHTLYNAVIFSILFAAAIVLLAQT